MTVINLRSTRRPFHALGKATANARSDETSLERGTTIDRNCAVTSSCAERGATWDVGHGGNQLGQI